MKDTIGTTKKLPLEYPLPVALSIYGRRLITFLAVVVASLALLGLVILVLGSSNPPVVMGFLFLGITASLCPVWANYLGRTRGTSSAENRTAGQWFVRFDLVDISIVCFWIAVFSFAGAFVAAGIHMDQAPYMLVRGVQTAPSSFRERVVMVALAEDLPASGDVRPASTPWPTETPLPASTLTGDLRIEYALVAGADLTRVPADLTILRAMRVAWPTPENLSLGLAAPARTSRQYRLIEARRLTPCENLGRRNVFVKVLDAAGNPVDGVVLVQTPSYEIGNVLDKVITGTGGPGSAEFALPNSGQYAVYVTEDGVNPASTEIAMDLRSNFPENDMCPGNTVGNSPSHNSFQLVFVKQF